MSGPATAVIAGSSLSSSRRRIHGRAVPYSKRTTHSWCIRTVPLTPVTLRTRSIRPLPVGITSSRVTTPVSVLNVVCSAAEFSTYARETW